MSTLDLSADSKQRPSEVITDLALTDDAVEIMQDCANTLAFLDRLCDEGLFHDAFVTLARVLPKQYAIIWGDRCLKIVPGALSVGGDIPAERSTAVIFNCPRGPWVKVPGQG